MIMPTLAARCCASDEHASAEERSFFCVRFLNDVDLRERLWARERRARQSERNAVGEMIAFALEMKGAYDAAGRRGDLV